MDVKMCNANVIFRPAVVVQLDIVLILLINLQVVSSCYISTFRRMGNYTSSTGGLSSTACVQYVQEVVSQNCVVIFSKTTCPYCKMAKNVFNEIGATYKVIELDEHTDGRRLQEALAQMTGARTVPRVFINGNCIGGGSDTKQLHQQGKLVPLIEQCASCCAATSSEGSGSGQFESAK
ncbi:glutaredoxin 2 isoform X2 [Anabas testudineus]|uniref:Glutaredoxin-2, mitochondrial n=1 Tax=Anabas testudineus TaxID=64144 RepID=A0AAQ6II46_ANATE|nr:glutaredoxin 2 isoform X2 [Anabas testudineus]